VKRAMSYLHANKRHPPSLSINLTAHQAAKIKNKVYATTITTR